MKLVKRHIKKFEQFILNPKDPNREAAKRKQIEPDSEEDLEIQDIIDNEDGKDIVDEIIEHFEKQKQQKIKRDQWK